MVAPSQSQLSPTPKPDKTRLAEGHALKANRKLNYREKRFCALIVQGMAARRAYMAISGVKNEDSASSIAHRWSIRPAVQAQIAKLRAEMTEEGAATRAERLHHLARVMRSEDTPPSVIVSAVAVNNRMTGDDEPFRKAAGDDLRVAFFVVRLGEEGGPSPSPSALGTADPRAVDAIIPVEARAGELHAAATEHAQHTQTPGSGTAPNQAATP